MHISRRLRLSLLSMMVLVALAAVLLGWAAAERRKRVAALTAELRSQQERVDWAERMHRMGYSSKAVLTTNQKRLAEVESQLKGLGASAKRP